MDTETPPLSEAIDAFLVNHAMSPITFGRKALNDPHFVAQLKAGRRLWPETETKARGFMNNFGGSAVAICSTCTLRPGSPEIRSCTRTDCPMVAREAQESRRREGRFPRQPPIRNAALRHG